MSVLNVTPNFGTNYNSDSQTIKRHREKLLTLNVLKMEDIVERNSSRTQKQTNGLRMKARPNILKEKAEILINLYKHGVAINIASSSLGINYNIANNIISKYNRDGGILDNKYLNSHKDTFETSNIIKTEEESIESDSSVGSNGITLDLEKEAETSLKHRTTISIEKKELLINLYKSGMSVVKAATTIGIKRSSASTIIKRYKADGGKLFKKCWGGRRKTLLNEEVLKTIKEIVETNPSITLHKIQMELFKQDISLSKTSIHTALSRHLEELIDCRRKHRTFKVPKNKETRNFENDSNMTPNKINLELNEKGNSTISKEKTEKIEEESIKSDSSVGSNGIALDLEKEAEISLKHRPTISIEKKEILINLYKSGMSVVKAATIIGIKRSSASTIIKRYKADRGKLFKKRWGGHRKTLLTQEVLKTIKEIVETNPSITLHKIQMELFKQDISLSKTSIHTALSRDLEELIDCRRKHRTLKVPKNKETSNSENDSNMTPNKINLELNEKGNSTISKEKKEILINLYESGMPIVKAANIMKVNCNTAHSIIRRHRKDGVVVRKLLISNEKKLHTSKTKKLFENNEDSTVRHLSIMTKKNLFQSIEKGRQTISKEQKQKINLHRSGTAIVNSANSVIKRKRIGRQKLIENTVENTEIVENNSTNNENKLHLDEKGRESISNEKKIMLINLYKSGTSIIDAANYVGIKYSSANSIIRRYKLDGEEFIEKQWGGHRKRLRTEEVLTAIKDMIKINPSITLHKIQMELDKKGISLSKTAIHRALKYDLGISTKIVRRQVECEEKIILD